MPFYEQLLIWAWKDTLDFGYEMKGSLNLDARTSPRRRASRSERVAASAAAAGRMPQRHAAMRSMPHF